MLRSGSTSMRNTSNDLSYIKRISVIKITDAKRKSLPKQIRIFQPTFRVNPKIRFNVEKVEQLLSRLVSSELEEVEYSDKNVPEICMSLAETIKFAVKELNYDRYRLLVTVTIGQKRQQGIHMFHSFLWDAERDSFASCNFENCHIFANIAVYAVYLD